MSTKSVSTHEKSIGYSSRSIRSSAASDSSIFLFICGKMLFLKVSLSDIRSLDFLVVVCFFVFNSPNIVLKLFFMRSFSSSGSFSYTICRASAENFEISFISEAMIIDFIY